MQQRAEKPPAKPQPQANVREIVPATGWVFSGTGFVTLISNAHGANSLTSTTTTCPQH
ncbi:MAG: hypothetical protein DSM106950_13025 [Stigonema ocellatum SAG 48.90 = DSM 106950]|nr:hypothetical protein [Stigonema ocellatum SAG 48.90 = DSM 106950]